MTVAIWSVDARSLLLVLGSPSLVPLWGNIVHEGSCVQLEKQCSSHMSPKPVQLTGRRSLTAPSGCSTLVLPRLDGKAFLG